MDFNRNMLSSEGGVSEIVGSILTMSITVVLFSSIFAGVQYLKPPEQTTHVEFNSNVEGLGQDTYYVNVTHNGGKDLQTVSTEIYITMDGSSYTYEFKDPEISLSGSDGTLWTLDEVATVKENKADLPLGSADTATVMVVDSSTNSVLWQDELLTEPEEKELVIKGAGIRYPQSWEKHAKPGDKVNIWAEARKSGVDSKNIDVKMSPPEGLFEETDYNLSYRSTHHTGRFTVEEDNLENGTYMIRLTARYGNNKTTTPLSINIGEPPFDPHPPDLVVGDITFDPIAPHDRESLTVTAKIYNQGTINITANLTFSDNGKNISHTGLHEKFLPGPVPTEVSVSYTVNGSGLHRIGVDVYNLTKSEDGDSLEDENPRDNHLVENLTVAPSILLVDDDQEMEGEKTDEISAMKSALEERAFDVDQTLPIPKGSNGPAYDEGKFRMKEYGVVIWMTGEQTLEDPLTNKDEQEIVDYIDNGGNFWLIGENLDNNHIGGTLKQKLGITSITSTATMKLKPPLKAEDPHENGTYGKYSYDASAEATDQISITGGSAYNDSNVLRDDHGTGDRIGYGENASGEGKTVVNSFMFTSVRSVSKGTMAQEVLEWMTDVRDRGGRDVAVATQDIDPLAPMYKSNVSINATIRNNGDEPVDVPVRMQIDDDTQFISPDDANKTTLYIPPNGATRTVKFTWEAKPVGKHRLKVIVDPYDQIEEINERNNDITYKNLNVTGDDVEVMVRFSVLIVDDDQATGSISAGNTTKLYRNILENLDKKGKARYAYNVTTVPTGDSGPSLSKMKTYNAIFWVTGQEANTLRSEDIVNLIDPDDQLGESAYLDSGGSNLLLTGDNVLHNLTGGVTGWDKGEAMLNRLGVQETGISAVNPDRLLGMKDDAVSHGLKYRFANGAQSFSALSGINSRVCFKDEAGNNIGAGRANDNTRTKSLVMGTKLSDIQGPVRDEFGNWPSGGVNTSDWAAWEEFIFMTTRWFGLKDNRPEVRVTGEDIELSNSHPMVSRSYRIQVKLENVGYKGTNVLVRVRDGSQHVGSDTVYVPPTTRTSIASNYYDLEVGTATVEINWQPVAAGVRNIRAEVDPLNLAREVGSGDGDEDMQFNNLGLIREEVYFFWDDMENGTGNWHHEATVMNVNGESPLDFINREGLDTNVVGEWDMDWSGSTDNNGNTYLQGNGTYDSHNESVDQFTDGEAHSVPSARWLPETEAGARKPIDMIINIDNSYSMNGQKIVNAKEAAKTAVGMLRSQDRVAVFAYGDDAHMLTGFQYATPANKQAINQTIDNMQLGFNNRWGTGLYDSIALAGEYADPNFDAPGPDNDFRQNAVNGEIILSDGYSIREEDVYTHAPWDQDSGDEKYGKRNDWNDPNHDWHNWPSPYTSDTFPEHGDSSTYGCLGIPWNVNTVGIGGSVDPLLRWTGWTAEDDINWYNHTSDPDQLKDIFSHFVEEMKGSAAGIKSMPPDGGDDGKKAVNYDNQDRTNESQEPSREDLESTSPVDIKIANSSGNSISMNPKPMATETRYMTSDWTSVNGLSTWNLRTSPAGSGYYHHYTYNGWQTGYWGIRVWQRSSSGSMTEITSGSPVAVVSRSWSGSGYQSASWTPPSTTLNPGDSIVVRVYFGTDSTPSTYLSSWTTEQLGPVLLEDEPWTVNYYTYMDRDLNLGWETELRYYFGNGYYSRIDNFQYTTNQPPTADFSYSTSGLTADFTDQSSDPDGTISSWSWDFGDGGTSASQNPSHTYGSAGDYTVTLTVTDNDGATDSVTKTVTVTEGDGSASYDIGHRKYRFLTTDQFRLGAGLLRFKPYGGGGLDYGKAEIDYVNKKWWLHAGADSQWSGSHEGPLNVITNGQSTVADGNLDNWPACILYNPKNGTEMWKPNIYDGSDWIQLRMQPIDNAVKDFVIIWEDIHSNDYGNADGDGDEWVRVTVLESGHYRVDVYRAKGGYKHEFHIGAEHVYTKPYGDTWVDVNSGLYYETHKANLPRFVSKATNSELQFYHRYWMTEGTNGGMIYLWMSNDPTDWEWDPNHRFYLKPQQSYNGNFNISFIDNEANSGGPFAGLSGYDTGLEDKRGNRPYWCFNGRSGEGTLDWEYTRVDLTPYITEYSYARVVFIQAQPGGIKKEDGWNPSMGWYIDDVKVVTTGANPSPDYWELKSEPSSTGHKAAHSGSHYWAYEVPDQNAPGPNSHSMPKGVDSSLISDPIDLTNAEYATFLAHMKFNIHPGAALPPDCFRVEVTTDGGMTWDSITYGVRSAWGYSGENDGQNLGTTEYGGISNPVPQGYSGVPGEVQDGQFVSGSYGYDWVPSVSLARVNADLSGFAGNVIRLRFRIVTNTTQMYSDTDYPLGFYLDDVIIFGESIGLDGTVSSGVSSSTNTYTQESRTSNEETRSSSSTQNNDDTPEEKVEEGEIESSKHTESESSDLSAKAIDAKKEPLWV